MCYRRGDIEQLERTGSNMSDIPRKSIETFGIRFVSQLIAVLTGILIARMLGPYGRGIFAYASSVFFIIVAFNAGQSLAISWQYGKLKRASGQVLDAMLRILIFGGIPVALIVVTVSLVVPGQRPLLAVALALPFAFLAQMATAFYIADGNVRVLNIQTLITTVGFFLALVPVLLVFHLGINGMLGAWVCSYVASAVYATFMLRQYSDGARPAADLVANVKEQAIFGVKSSANSVIALLNFRIDIFLVLFILGPKALGVYSVAVGAGEVVWQLTRPLALSAFGRINSGSLADATNLTAKCVRHSLAMVALTGLVLYFIGPFLITTLYGHAFANAGTVLRFLLPGIVAYSMTPFFSAFFSQQLSKPAVPLIILSISTVVCAVITIATIRPLGIVAGAIGTSVSYVTTLIISALLFRSETGMPLRSLFGFRRDDIQPYARLWGSLWKRVSSITLGG